MEKILLYKSIADDSGEARRVGGRHDMKKIKCSCSFPCFLSLCLSLYYVLNTLPLPSAANQKHVLYFVLYINNRRRFILHNYH